MSEPVDLEAVVVEALQDSINEDGEVDFYAAAPMVLQAIRVVAEIRVTRTDGSLDWHLLRDSLAVTDPYEVMDPEVRATYPLTESMVQQNHALLSALVLALEVEGGVRRPRRAG